MRRDDGEATTYASALKAHERRRDEAKARGDAAAVQRWEAAIEDLEAQARRVGVSTRAPRDPL